MAPPIIWLGGPYCIIFMWRPLCLRPRPKGPEVKTKADARCYEAETEAEAKILASRLVWPQVFNISVTNCFNKVIFFVSVMN